MEKGGEHHGSIRLKGWPLPGGSGEAGPKALAPEEGVRQKARGADAFPGLSIYIFYGFVSI